MANVYGTNYTKFLAGGPPASFMGPAWNGKVRCIHDIYECASTATGTVIYVGKLYAGEVFLTGWVFTDDLGSATAITVGDIGLTDGVDTGDADRYLTSTICATGNQVTQLSRDIGLGYSSTVDRDIIITTATEEATGTIEIVILKGVF